MSTATREEPRAGSGRGPQGPAGAVPSLLDGGASAGGWERPPTSWQRVREDPAVVRAGQVFGPALAILALQFVAFPMPPGVYAYGVVLGALGALVAVGMALTWRSNRIVNFAQAQLGVVPAVISVSLLLFAGLGYPLSFAAGLAAAIALGAVVDLVGIRRFTRASRLVLTVATIGLAQLLSAAALGLPGLWGRTAVDVTTGVVDLPLDWSWAWGPVVLTDDHVVALAVALAGLVGTSLFLRRTPAGIAVRASAERAERAGLLGIPVARLEALVWILAAVLSFLGVFFRTAVVGLPLNNPFVGFGTALGAVAALMLGRIDDLPSVAASAVALGVLEQAVTWNHGDTPELVYPVYAVVVVLALSRRRFEELRAAQGDVSSWQAADAVRAVPRRLQALPEVRAVRAALAVGFVGAAALLPAVLGPADELRAAVLVVWAIVGLSVVVLTGWAGQVSLGQMAFAGYGAGFGALAFLELGWDAMLAVPVAGLFGAAIAVVVGLPALRLRGVFLAAITLAFSVASSSFVLSQRHTSWIPRGRIESVDLFGAVQVDTPRDTYWLCLSVAVAAFVAVAGIRRSRTGRVLLALRENELAARSHGISVTRAKLTGFALSGALASTAGCLYVVAVFGYSESLFTPTDSFVAFTSTVVGGAGSMVGAVAGAMFARGGTWFLRGTWTYVPSAVGVLVVVWLLPGGIAGLLYRGRDAFLRRVARRRGIDVPSLDVRGAGPDADLPARAPRWRLSNRSARDTWAVPPPPRPSPHAEERPPSDPPWDGRPAGAVLSCRGLDVAYGNVQVLFDVDLDVRSGEVVALLGTNGAGKSTLLKAVSGVLTPRRGSISLEGRPIAGTPAHQVAAQGVVQMPGGHGVFPSLTVDENLRMACWLERGTSRRARHGIGLRPGASELDARLDAVLARFPVLGQRLTARAGDLSGGQQQMLSLGMALLAKPKVLLIDELSLGLAPVVVGQLLDVVRAVAAQGTAVVLVEQSVTVALEVAKRAVFMEKGVVRFDGVAADLAGHPELLRSVFLEGASARLGAPSGPTGAYAPSGRRVRPAPSGNGAGPDASLAGALAVLPASATVAPRFELRGVTVSFGGIRAVDDVTVTVEPGEIVGFIGPNGAGKTTLLDVASGVTGADRGLVLVDGVDLATMPADERSRRGIARSFQDARLYPGLTVEQVLGVALDRWHPVTDPFRAAARTPSLRRAEAAVTARTDELIGLLGLERYRDSLTSELSTGTRRIVDLACVLAHHPTLVLLDEPSSGIAQRETEALGPLLRRVRDVLGCSMLVVEHDMALLTGLADRLVAFDQGAVVASGPPGEVLRDPRVVASYLGTRAPSGGVGAVRSAALAPPPPRPPSGGPGGRPRGGARGPGGRGPGRLRTLAVPVATVVAVLAYAVVGGLGRAPSAAEADRPTPAERLGLGEPGSHAELVPATWQDATAEERAATPWVENCDPATGRIELPSIYAPPCVPSFAGDNGGATWDGVTADTIRVALYQGGTGDIRTELTRTLDSAAEVDETTDRLAEMLDDVAETYGRRVELVRFQASGGMDDEVAARADAVRLADEVAPFAVIGGPPLTTVFAEELAVRGIICIDCGLATPDSFHQENAPFVWGPLPTPEEFLTILGDFLFSRVMGDDAVFAGDPELQEQERTIGVVRFEQRIPVFSDLERLVTMISEANGVTPAANEVYTFDLDKMPERATTIIARMKAAGVTTVLFLGDPIMPIYLTQAATAQDYFPEWVVTGTVLTDSTVMGRQYDQRQWAHAFGLSVLPAKSPVDALEANRLHQWYYGRPPAASGTAQLTYQDLMLLYLGIHMAGPDLRPETFRDGMFNYPAAGGGPTTPRISFGDNELFIAEDLGTRIDYLAADDMTEVWWDAEAVGPDEVGNEGQGMWRYANGGRRYLPNDMPEGDTDAFREEGSVLGYDEPPPEDRPPDYPSPRR